MPATQPDDFEYGQSYLNIFNDIKYDKMWNIDIILWTDSIIISFQEYFGNGEYTFLFRYRLHEIKGSILQLAKNVSPN